MEFNKLIYTVEEGICTIQMNYMKNLNAIDVPMAKEILAALHMADEDPAVRVVVIKGSKAAFSAGGDVGYFYNLSKQGIEFDLDELIDLLGKIAITMKSLTKLIIASVNGAAAGAGSSLAFGSDFIIATDKAFFMLAFVNLGLVPDTGAAYLLAKSIGAQKAMELAVTGRRMMADEAQQLGLIYKLVTPETLEEETMKFAKKLARGPLVSYKNIKKQIFEASFHDYQRWLLEAEAPCQQECVPTKDFTEGCAAFIEKRPANFIGE